MVFVDGKPAKHLYRTFNLKTVEGVDDYKSLEEVLERRFRRLSRGTTNNGKAESDSTSNNSNEDAWSLPDLVVIDGGRGQLNAALKGISRAANGVLEAAAQADFASNSTLQDPLVQVCALAKNKEELFIPGKSSAVNEGSPDSPALLLLRAIRDESHRFALKAHRRRRSL